MDTPQIQQTSAPSPGTYNPEQTAQFAQYGVQQGYGSRQNYGYQAPEMAWVPLNGRMMSLPTEMIYRMEGNLTQTDNSIKQNNITVALSVLESIALNCLDLRKAFHSYLRQDDDRTVLNNFETCIAELKQANPQKPFLTHELSCLVTWEDPVVTNSREIFEQCIKVTEKFIPILQGRKEAKSTYEKIKETVGWSGWQQQAKQISISNRALGRLLNIFLAKDPQNKAYKEVLCFQQTVEYITYCFSQSAHPNQKGIEAIYAKNGFQFVTASPNVELEGVVEDHVMAEPSNQNTGILGNWSGLWGGN